MAVEGYTKEQYDQLVREMRSAPQVTLGEKRPRVESSSEVQVIYSRSDGYLLTGSDRMIPMIRKIRQVSGGLREEGVKEFIVWDPGPSLALQVSLTGHPCLERAFLTFQCST